jgi:hypothetical protein
MGGPASASGSGVAARSVGAEQRVLRRGVGERRIWNATGGGRGVEWAFYALAGWGGVAPGVRCWKKS